VELGFSLHTGIYNTFKREGLVVDERRRLTIMALDGEYQVGGLTLQGEVARAEVGIPQSLLGLFAETQQGVYAQAVYSLFDGVLPMFPQSKLGVGVRYDYVDLDAGIDGDDTQRVTVGAMLRLVPDTIIKLDYQHSWMFDRLTNRTRAAVVQFGVATYF
jgi:hypothetical protein